MRSSCASRDLTTLHRAGAVRVQRRPGSSYADIARARSMPAYGASSFESEESKRRVFSFKTVPWLSASGYDPRPIMRAPSNSRGAATTLDVVRGRGESVAGSRFAVVARRSRTVVKGQKRKRSKDGTPREAVDHGTTAGRARMRRAQRAPRSTFGLGRACPVHRAFFSSAPRPALARRAFNHSPSPRGLFTPALDVRSSSKPRWLQFQAVTPCSNDTLAAGAELRTTRTGLPGSALRRRARARGACPGRRRSARSRRAARRGRGAPPSRSRRPIRRCASGRPSRG